MTALEREMRDACGVDPLLDDESERLCIRVRSGDIARLDQMATRRGVERELLVRQAIDALLAQELWSGGFVANPPITDLSGLGAMKARDAGRGRRGRKRR